MAIHLMGLWEDTKVLVQAKDFKIHSLKFLINLCQAKATIFKLLVFLRQSLQDP